ncbi:hypothetical protein [Caulobacter sp. LARHSG274]
MIVNGILSVIGALALQTSAASPPIDNQHPRAPLATETTLRASCVGYDVALSFASTPQGAVVTAFEAPGGHGEVIAAAMTAKVRLFAAITSARIECGGFPDGRANIVYLRGKRVAEARTWEEDLRLAIVGDEVRGPDYTGLGKQ